MRSRPFPLIAFLLFLAACTSPGAGPPPVDIPRLARLTADLQMAEALTIEIPVSVRDSVRQLYFDKITTDHGYTLDEYDSLLWIVRREPVWIDSLFSLAGDSIAARDARLREQ